jgi:hypothetical protein
MLVIKLKYCNNQNQIIYASKKDGQNYQLKESNSLLIDKDFRE